MRGQGDGEGGGDPDGFEGNAQTFRIVTTLAQRRNDFDGLNLTRLTLDSILKYPWLREEPETNPRYAKYGAYESEKEAFVWARRGHPQGSDRRSANAEVVNWADDVAYAVHDVEDFYRSGLLPLDRLRWSQDERAVFLDWLHTRWSRLAEQEAWIPPIPLDDWESARRAADRLFSEEFAFSSLTRPYAGERSQRKELRRATAILISRYLGAVRLEKVAGTWSLGFPDGDAFRQEVELLKELVWYYVIDRPALRTQQYGQERIVTELFTTYRDAVARKDLAVLPASMRESVDEATEPALAARAAADAVASLTERQAVALWRKLTGAAQGTLLDFPIS